MIDKNSVKVTTQKKLNSRQKVDKLSGDHNVKTLALKLWNDYDKESRLHAVYHLSKTNHFQIMPILEKALSIEKDQEVLSEIINAMNYLVGKESKQSLTDFFINSRDPFLSKKIALILSRNVDDNVIKAIKTRIRNEVDPELKIISLRILSNCSDEETLSMIEDRLFADPHLQVRTMAAISLGRFAHPKASDILLKALQEIIPSELRREIIWALSKREDLQTNSLVTHFHNEPDLENQKMILWLIKQKGKLQNLFDLVQSLDYPLCDDLQKDLVLSFGKFKDKLSADQLIKIFQKAHSNKIRHQSLWSLSQVISKKHLPILIKLKEQEKDPYIRQELVQVLQMFSG
ncbi:MAG: HEAT repeat domain-containing protein [bacterium]